MNCPKGHLPCGRVGTEIQPVLSSLSACSGLCLSHTEAPRGPAAIRTASLGLLPLIVNKLLERIPQCPGWSRFPLLFWSSLLSCVVTAHVRFVTVPLCADSFITGLPTRLQAPEGRAVSVWLPCVSAPLWALIHVCWMTDQGQKQTKDGEKGRGWDESGSVTACESVRPTLGFLSCLVPKILPGYAWAPTHAPASYSPCPWPSQVLVLNTYRVPGPALGVADRGGLDPIPPYRNSQSHHETRLVEQREAGTDPRTGTEKPPGSSVLLENQRSFREGAALGLGLEGGM